MILQNIRCVHTCTLSVQRFVSLSYYLLCSNHFCALGFFWVLVCRVLFVLLVGFWNFVCLFVCFVCFVAVLSWGFFVCFGFFFFFLKTVKIERKPKFSVSTTFAKGDVCLRETVPALRRLCFYIAEHTEHKEKDLSSHISFHSLLEKEKVPNHPLRSLLSLFLT